MKLQTRTKQAIESLVLAWLPLAVNLLFADDPGFLKLAGLPYLATGIIFTAFYGLPWGLTTAALSLAAGLGLFPLAQGRLDPAWLASLADSLRYSGPLSLLCLLAVAFIQNRQSQVKEKFRQRLRRSVQRDLAVRRKASSLERVNRILEDRVANQKDSMTLLRSQVHKLASLNLDQALASMLETVRLFTDMKSGSVWILGHESDQLETAAHWGWSAERQAQGMRSLEHSIEGYVFRNGKQFSIRMVMGSQEFTKLDVRDNILTYPIRVRGRIWGVLNIEDLPFERYSLYTESVLEILLSLIEPNLAEILDHQALYDQQEVDEDTGLPRVTQLYRTLAKDLEQLGPQGESLALVIVEISNFGSLLESWPRAGLKQLLPKIKEAIDRANGMKSRAFHFKQDNQLALLVGGLEQDGTSFLCLEILSLIAGLGLEIGGKPLDLEIIIGFSTNKDTGNSDETMIRTAESLLDMQRV